MTDQIYKKQVGGTHYKSMDIILYPVKSGKLSGAIHSVCASKII